MARLRVCYSIPLSREYTFYGCARQDNKYYQQDASEEEKRKLFETMLQKGMEQIKNRGYHKKYIESGKAIYLAAFAFLGRDEIEMKFDKLN